jgi:glutaredoxin-related protein
MPGDKEGLENKKIKLKYAKIMRRILLVFFIAIAIPILVLAQGEKKKALYFYSETCIHCKQVNEYFQKEGIYERYDIKKIETSGPYNYAYLNKFFESFGISEKERGIPAIFFEDKAIIGDQPIIDSFVEEIGRVEASEFPDPEKISDFLQKNKETEQSGGNISNAILIWAALVDAINPCAFDVLILLVATVASSKGRKESLYSGLLFSLSIFISYFLMGLGIYKAIGFFNLPQIFSIVIESWHPGLDLPISGFLLVRQGLCDGGAI